MGSGSSTGNVPTSEELAKPNGLFDWAKKHNIELKGKINGVEKTIVDCKVQKSISGGYSQEARLVTLKFDDGTEQEAFAKVSKAK